MLGFSRKKFRPPSSRTCPKEASGNSTEPASLGVKQSAADEGILGDRTAIQTAGAVSGGRAATLGESSFAHTSPPGPHPLPWPPPPAPRSSPHPAPPRACRASPELPGSRSRECGACHVQEGRLGPRQGRRPGRRRARAGSGPLAPATPPLAPRSGTGAAAGSDASRAGEPTPFPATRGAPGARGGSSRLQGTRPLAGPLGHLRTLAQLELATWGLKQLTLGPRLRCPESSPKSASRSSALG